MDNQKYQVFKDKETGIDGLIYNLDKEKRVVNSNLLNIEILILVGFIGIFNEKLNNFWLISAMITLFISILFFIFYLRFFLKNLEINYFYDLFENDVEEIKEIYKRYSKTLEWKTFKFLRIDIDKIENVAYVSLFLFLILFFLYFLSISFNFQL